MQWATAMGFAVCGVVWSASAFGAQTASKPERRPAAVVHQMLAARLPVVSAETRTFSRFVVASADHAALPFAIVDKNAALLSVYRADGTWAGSTAVLLGQALGDRSAAGVGERAEAGRLRRDDRTTPAGRFVAEPGVNASGEPVVWVDYFDALAIHRLRAGPSRERRAQRLASPRPSERRVSAGCIVVPVAFYERVVEPVLARSRSIVYVLPEERPVDAFRETLDSGNL